MVVFRGLSLILTFFLLFCSPKLIHGDIISKDAMSTFVSLTNSMEGRSLDEKVYKAVDSLLDLENEPESRRKRSLLDTSNDHANGIQDKSLPSESQMCFNNLVAMVADNLDSQGSSKRRKRNGNTNFETNKPEWCENFFNEQFIQEGEYLCSAGWTDWQVAMALEECLSDITQDFWAMYGRRRKKRSSPPIPPSEVNCEEGHWFTSWIQARPFCFPVIEANLYLDISEETCDVEEPPSFEECVDAFKDLIPIQNQDGSCFKHPVAVEKAELLDICVAIHMPVDQDNVLKCPQAPDIAPEMFSVYKAIADQDQGCQLDLQLIFKANNVDIMSCQKLVGDVIAACKTAALDPDSVQGMDEDLMPCGRRRKRSDPIPGGYGGYGGYGDIYPWFEMLPDHCYEPVNDVCAAIIKEDLGSGEVGCSDLATSKWAWVSGTPLEECDIVTFGTTPCMRPDECFLAMKNMIKETNPDHGSYLNNLEEAGLRYEAPKMPMGNLRRKRSTVDTVMCLPGDMDMEAKDKLKSCVSMFINYNDQLKCPTDMALEWFFIPAIVNDLDGCEADIASATGYQVDKEDCAGALEKGKTEIVKSWLENIDCSNQLAILDDQAKIWARGMLEKKHMEHIKEIDCVQDMDHEFIKAIFDRNMFCYFTFFAKEQYEVSIGQNCEFMSKCWQQCDYMKHLMEGQTGELSQFDIDELFPGTDFCSLVTNDLDGLVAAYNMLQPTTTTTTTTPTTTAVRTKTTTKNGADFLHQDLLVGIIATIGVQIIITH